MADFISETRPCYCTKIPGLKKSPKKDKFLFKNELYNSFENFSNSIKQGFYMWILSVFY